MGTGIDTLSGHQARIDRNENGLDDRREVIFQVFVHAWRAILDVLYRLVSHPCFTFSRLLHHANWADLSMNGLLAR